jgi:hypothetical protein
LIPNYEGRVEAVMLADDGKTFVTRRVPQIPVELAGIPNDRHYGLLRPADSRQKLYPKGTPIANRRQLSLVSIEECKLIAQNMGITEIRPEWLGVNMLIQGVPHLTQLPPGARLIFPDGTGLICEGENLPCLGPARVIESSLEQPGISKLFVTAAKKLRGIVCSVEKEGEIHAGDNLHIYL